MRIRKNVVSFLTKSLLVVLFLAVVLMVFAPSLINLELVKKTIKENVSSNVGGRMTYRNLNLRYFPRPHVVIHEAEISLPESYAVNIQWIRIYPKILPLFAGQLQFAHLTLDYADFSMKLPRIEDVASSQPENNRSFEEIIKTFTQAARDLPEFKLPDLDLRVKNGRVNLIDPFGHKFMLRELQAEYAHSHDRREFSIQCKSNLWEQINISGTLDTSDLKGRGRVQLSHFRPQTLIAYLFPDSALRITETRANVSIDFQSDGAGKLTADVAGVIPFLNINRGSEKLVIKGIQLKGAVAVDGKSARANLTELGLEYPALKMTGAFSYDENLQELELALNGSRIDADAVRQAALALAGESETIRTIFDVVRGGRVPWMTVKLRGRTVRDFAQADNLVIQGRMTEGKIFIPGADLDLEDVFGDADISNGILKGNKLQARFGKSYGRDGSIALGLNQHLAPFHLNIGVDADLSQLPPVLKRIVADRNFLSELERVEDVKGTAQGILTLGDNLENLSARVEVTQVQLNVRYDRIPYPIKIIGGRFLLEDSRIAVEDFNAEIGMSSLMQLSAALDWAKRPTLKTQAKTARFDLAEVHAWLLSLQTFKATLADIRSINGTIATEDLKISGPVFEPRDWHFQTRGTIDKVTLASSLLPRTVRVDRGKFTFRNTQLEFSKVDAFMGKSSGNRIFGNVNWAKKPVISASADASSFDLEDIKSILLSNKVAADALKSFRPLRGTLAFNSLSYSGPAVEPTAAQVSFSGTIRQLSVQSKRLPGPLRVGKGRFAWHENQLSLKNVDAALGGSTVSDLSAGYYSRRNASFHLQGTAARLAAGEIHSFLSSFAQLQPAIKDFSPSKGMLVLADFDLSGPINEPTAWRYESAGEIKSIVIQSPALEQPVTIEHGFFNLSTDTSAASIRRSLTLAKTNLTWNESALTIEGAIGTSEGKTLLNLKIDAEGPQWSQISRLLDYFNQHKGGSDKSGSSLQGKIRFSASNFYYEPFNVSPLDAEITFEPHKTVAKINKADICGISLQGLVNLKNQTLDLYFVPTPVEHNLDSALACLTAKDNLATGTYDLSGEIMAEAKPEALSHALTGNLTFSAEKGRIYRFGLLAKLLAILNVTEIYRGHVPDLAGEGFAYHSMSASAKLQGGKFTMEECSIDGASMGIACTGDIDLIRREMDLTILVAPFKTVDRIVDILPLIGSVLGGKLISIPFRATGNLEDPYVYPLPPKAVGSGLLGILERTLKLPLTIIQPVISSLKKGTPPPPGIPGDSPR